ncbi:YheC/YheD family endospore coat-associated protein [Paenibacillus sp. 481]|uniref:YheC/YheD family endospore coat-associated protein n=1 Tax=Paenibacillus sp. 481 TaxID=2835869 RepID=UPI001E36DB54|nr:YheC/YheD family protein [Paenibacillus sp. 481]UHA75020.1 YheC/YheD family protein [Paenibacillus sp. 481]
MSTKQTVIGILSYRNGTRFFEPKMFREWIAAGKSLGVSVYIFDSYDVREKSRQIYGFTHNGKGWVGKLQPWPDIVIDRRRSKITPHYRALRRKKLFPFINGPFISKLPATKMFAADDRTARWVPETAPYTANNLKQLAAKYATIYAKPSNGTGGYGVVRIKRTSTGSYLVWGRQRNARLQEIKFKNIAGVNGWLLHWSRNQRRGTGGFMLQQGINTEHIPNRSIDARLMYQRDAEGKWQTTGIGMRISAERSPNSNLINRNSYGAKFRPFLIERFGEARTDEIEKDCEELAKQLAAVIDSRGFKLYEIGIDLAVDVDGRVWLIEVNPKPSRDILITVGDHAAHQRGLELPLEYAMFKARQHQ